MTAVTAGDIGTRWRPLRRAFAAWLDETTPVKAWVAVLVAVALYISRSGDGVADPQFYAEDGSVFFVDARLYGPASLLLPYAGYLHVVPRIIGLATGLFPAAAAPALYILASIGVVAWTAATIATANVRCAWLLAVCALLVPVGDEVFGLLTNVQWLSQAALILVAVTPSPTARAARVNQIVFALVFALTGPFAIFVAPMALWRTGWNRTDRHAWMVCAIVVAAAAIQLNFVLREPSPYEGVREPLYLLRQMLDRWVGQSAHQGLTVKSAMVRDDVVVGLAMIVAIVASPRVAGPLFAYAATVLAGTYLRFVADSHYFDGAVTGERYFYLPRLVILWALVLCATRLRRTSSIAVVALVMMALSFDHWVRHPLPRLPWRTEAWKIDQGQAVRIITNPSPAGETAPDAWVVQLPARP